MKLSIVIAILNSHEIVKRQIRHFREMNLHEPVEFVFVDDGSNPPLDYGHMGLRNLTFYYTNEKRPWTQGLARNLGASKARGEYLFFTDIDHIITREAIDAVLGFKGDKMVFLRLFGILSRGGDIISDAKSLLEFGLDPARVKSKRGMGAGLHGNTYAIKRTIFDKIGRYDPRLCEKLHHVGGKFMSEERRFNNKYDGLVKRKQVETQVVGPSIYFYPVGRFRTDGNNNPYNLFHTLSLEQVPQPMKP